jgi:hypothetical protein
MVANDSSDLIGIWRDRGAMHKKGWYLDIMMMQCSPRLPKTIQFVSNIMPHYQYVSLCESGHETFPENGATIFAAK